MVQKFLHTQTVVGCNEEKGCHAHSQLVCQNNGPIKHPKCLFNNKWTHFSGFLWECFGHNSLVWMLTNVQIVLHTVQILNYQYDAQSWNWLHMMKIMTRLTKMGRERRIIRKRIGLPAAIIIIKLLCLWIGFCTINHFTPNHTLNVCVYIWATELCRNCKADAICTKIK